MKDHNCHILHYGKCGKMVRWTLDSEGTMCIYGDGAMEDFACDPNGFGAETPWEEWSTSIYRLVVYSGITSIGAYAWRGCMTLTEIQLPEGLLSIGAGAFEYCVFMSEIRIPASIREIHEEVFRACYNLSSVILPTDLEFLGGRAFQECSRLISIRLPENLSHFEVESAFEGCRKLRLVYFPKKVSRIPDGMFKECSSLDTIVFRGGAVEIGENAFDNLNIGILYPDAEESWTEDRIAAYGGETLWANYFSEEELHLEELES